MNSFTLPLDKNTVGADSLALLYTAINAAYPTHKLTKANSKVIKIQPAESPLYPTRTYLRIQKGTDEQAIYEYFYNRYNINDYLKNPVFTKTEAAAAAKLSNSEKLVALLATKTRQNFRSVDFWTDPVTLPLSGGKVPPNWYMESVSDSIYWCGELELWLHT